MPDKIPTAETFQNNWYENKEWSKKSSFEMMIEYAKILLEAHKEAIKEGAKLTWKYNLNDCDMDEEPKNYFIDKESIETASKNFIDNLKQ